jgi:site-specific recombinase XerD
MPLDLTLLPVPVSPTPGNIDRVAVEQENRAARGFLDNSKAATTRRSYASDFRVFVQWCKDRDLCPLPAEPATLVRHISWCATEIGMDGGGLSASSIGRRLCAIAYAHKLRKLPSPCRDEEVIETLAGIRRTLGTAGKPKSALTADLIQRLLNECKPDSLGGLRDRALVALGFAGAFRRSELVAVGVADLEATEEGFRVHIRRSKTDQQGKGHTIPIPAGFKIKPVKAVQDWLAAAGINEGPVFREVRGMRVSYKPLSGHAVAEIVKKLAIRAGLDPALFSGHSLRAGFLTSAAESGASPFSMQQVSRHKSLDVLSGYVRVANLFQNAAGASFL